MASLLFRNLNENWDSFFLQSHNVRRNGATAHMVSLLFSNLNENWDFFFCNYTMFEEMVLLPTWPAFSSAT